MTVKGLGAAVYLVASVIKTLFIWALAPAVVLGLLYLVSR